VNFAAAAAAVAAAASTVKQPRRLTRQLGGRKWCCPFQYLLNSSSAL